MLLPAPRSTPGCRASAAEHVGNSNRPLNLSPLFTHLLLSISERHEPLKSQIIVWRLQLVHHGYSTCSRLCAIVPEDVKEARVEALKGGQALQIERATLGIRESCSGCHDGLGSKGPAQERPWGEALSCCCTFAGLLAARVNCGDLSAELCA